MDLKKKNNNKVSVIIPTFNRVKSLERAIKSIVLQDYKNWEIIVIDNFSTDHTEQFIAELNNIEIIYKKFKNYGSIAKSRNEGIKLSKGDIIAFLDSDDWWTPDKLSICIEEFNLDSSKAILYHNCIITDGLKRKKTNSRKLSNDAYNDLIINGNTIVTSSVVIKKSVFSIVELFNEDIDFQGWEDYDLWIRIAKENYSFAFIVKSLGYYWKDESNFDTPERILKNLDLIKKHIIEPYNKINLRSKIWWPDYTRGIALLKLGSKSSSFFSFLRVITLKAPIFSKVKSIYYMFFKIWVN